VVAIVGPPRGGLGQELVVAGGGHDGVHVDDERSPAEPDGDLVVPGELDLPFPVKGQAAGPGGQGHDLAGLDAAGLQHPDLGDQAGGEGDGDGMGRPLGRGQAQVEPERGRPGQRRDRRRHRRQADRAGAGEGHQRLRDRPDPPQGARPDPALGGDGHVDQGAVPGAAVDGDLELLGPPHQLVAAQPAGCHQAGRQPGHGGLAQLREGVLVPVDSAHSGMSPQCLATTRWVPSPPRTTIAATCRSAMASTASAESRASSRSAISSTSSSGRRWAARCPVRPLRWRWRLWERPEPAGIMTTRPTLTVTMPWGTRPAEPDQ
jgi:hypothetical protein